MTSSDHLGHLPLDPDIDEVEDARHHRPPLPAPRGVPARIAPRVVAVVYAGGVLGGLARYQVGRLLPVPDWAFPWATFLVNTVGAFCLALLLVLVVDMLRPRWWLRPGLGTGFLGAFTTFSSVVTSTDHLAVHGRAGVAAGYLIGSMLAGVAAAALGLLAGRLVAARRLRRTGEGFAR